MKNALITGGTGFLGQAISQHLTSTEYQVYTFDQSYPKDSNFHRFGTILNFNEILAAVNDIDVVYHLAGMLGTTELLNRSATAIDVNIKGTVNVLEACRLKGVTKIFYPTKPNEWLNTYSITKRAGEDFVWMYNKLYGLDVRVLRWLNAYGPGQKLWPIRKAVPVMILQALYDLPIEIFGDGNQPVDLIYTEDLAQITVAYTELDSVLLKTVDTGLSFRMTVYEMADKIRILLNSNSAIRYLPMRLGEDDERRVKLLANKSAAEQTGLSVATDITSGLIKTIEYYSNLPTRIHEAAIRFYYGHLPAKGDKIAQTILGKISI